MGPEIRDDGVLFRVVAPRRERVALVLESEGGRVVGMEASARGFSCFVPGLRAGALYRFRLDDEQEAFPDPASRFQPRGPHGPSQVVDPHAYRWRDGAHQGVTLRGQVIYEMHVGTFTREGTLRAAAQELAALRGTGITLVELMPLAEFPGEFGWGYDGVSLFAPTHLYGSPDDVRYFVDEAHAQGMGVILDVVYNHLGPDGNYLAQYYDRFFADRATPWGPSINFDGDGSAEVRDFYRENACYWIREFHFDGLRLDSTQDIHDRSEPHIVAEIVRAAREAASPRSIVVVAENDRQQPGYVRSPRERGYGCDALWNDDFHHSALVAATGRAEGYYSQSRGTPQELISAVRWGFLFQGQSSRHPEPRGEPALDVRAPQFVLSLQNHDQVANSTRGLRLHALTSPGRARALKTLLLLAPGTPMLFQGEEFDASSPFLFFADHEAELARQVRAGRAEFLAQFPSARGERSRLLLADPGARSSFERSKLDLAERERHAHAQNLTQSLLELRRNDPVFLAQDAERVHGAVLATEALLLRFLGAGGDDRLLLVNLGREVELRGAAEPLLAAPAGREWRMILSTEDPENGGCGTPPLDADWRLQGHAAWVLAAGG